jgi:hypothetical protein
VGEERSLKREGGEVGETNELMMPLGEGLADGKGTILASTDEGNDLHVW